MPNTAASGNRLGNYAIVSVVRSAPASAPRRSWWPKALVLALGITLVAGADQWSAAQRRDGPRIIVPPTIVAEPASQAAFAIQVGPPDTLPSNSFIRLRGFPTSVSLTEGHAIAPGSWAVPLFGLATLKAIVPAGVSGRNEISITLVGVDGTTLAETKTALVIAAPPPPERIVPEPPRRQVSQPPLTTVPMRRPPPPPPSRDLPDEDKARAERMLAQGARHLEQGNISAARMFFQRAAEAGLADGALKMGGTYDPVELTRTSLVGASPDRNEARKWYERARDLGAIEAEARLSRLGAR